jgi:hypothetical protein
MPVVAPESESFTPSFQLATHDDKNVIRYRLRLCGRHNVLSNDGGDNWVERTSKRSRSSNDPVNIGFC